MLIKLFIVGFCVSAVPHITVLFEFDPERISNIIFPIMRLVFALIIFFPQCLSEAIRLIQISDTIRKLEKEIEFEREPLRKMPLFNRIVKLPNAIIVCYVATLLQCVFAGVIFWLNL